MTEQSAGHLIVRSLEAHGVERVFTVPGESYLDVLDGLYDSDVQNVVCRQEGGVTYMAEAYGKLTGRPGVAMVTRGPGASNAFVGVHLAWQDSTPLVLFVGLVPVAHREREAFQEFDPHQWFGTQAKRVMVLDDPDWASEYVAQAFFAARSGRPGPVVVGLPEDVITRLTEAPVVAPIPVTDGAVGAEDLEDLRAALEEASRPAILVGGPRWTPAAAEQVTAFAERHGIPVVSDWRAADRVPGTSPVNAGETGYGRSRGTVDVLENADVLLVIGGTLSDIPTDGFTVRQDPAAVNWLVNIDPSLRQHSGAVTRQVLASPVAFGRALAQLELGAHPDWSAWLEAPVAARRKRFEIPATAGNNVAGTADMELVMKALIPHLPADTAVVYGSGNHTAWANTYLPTGPFPSQLSVRNGTMGYSVPGAVSVSLQQPERFVLSVSGDGEFLMNSQELATARQYGAHPLILVVDNGQYGTIRAHQENHYPGRVSGTQLSNPDFATVARGYGAFGARLERNEDIESVLAEAVRAVTEDRIPAVVHVVADPAKLLPGM